MGVLTDERADDRGAADADRNEHQHPDRVTVHVIHVNETERTTFKMLESATLQQVWDEAYKELKIEKKPTDIFQTGGKHPVSLMPQLGLTLREARKQKIINDHHFGIASETGGA